MNSYSLKDKILAKRRGFTLIELLVVITIITILTGISIVAYSRIQKNARDGKRKADLASVQNALELYYADNSGYPPTDQSADPPLLCAGSPETGPLCTLKPNYSQDIPKDPLGESRGYFYSADTADPLSQHYTLWTKMEISSSGNDISQCYFYANHSSWFDAPLANWYCVSF